MEKNSIRYEGSTEELIRNKDPVTNILKSDEVFVDKEKIS